MNKSNKAHSQFQKSVATNPSTTELPRQKREFRPSKFQETKTLLPPKLEQPMIHKSSLIDGYIFGRNSLGYSSYYLLVTGGINILVLLVFAMMLHFYDDKVLNWLWVVIAILLILKHSAIMIDLYHLYKASKTKLYSFITEILHLAFWISCPILYLIERSFITLASGIYTLCIFVIVLVEYISTRKVAESYQRPGMVVIGLFQIYFGIRWVEKVEINDWYIYCSIGLAIAIIISLIVYHVIRLVKAAQLEGLSESEGTTLANQKASNIQR